MGWFTRAQEVKVSPVTSEVAPGGAANLDKLNANMAVEYVRSIYLWLCVDKIGSMASSVPLLIVKAEDSQLSREDMAVQRLIERPNPQWSGAALQYFVAASIAVANKAFLLRVRGTGGVTLELWPLLPTDVTVLYETGTQMIAGFDVSTGGRMRRYEVDEDGNSDVIYIRRPALSWQTDKSPAAIAAAPAEVFTRILQRCADIISNSSNITGLLSTDKEMTKNSLKEIKDAILQFTTGRSQSGGTLVSSNAKWTMTRLSEDPSSALSVEIKDSIARDIVVTFGVPTQLVGLPGTDTYNNIALARVGFLTDTILPSYVGLYIAALNHELMTGDAKIAPDVEHIPAMMAYRRELTKTAVEATMLSVNEQREMLGYPRYEDDELANVPIKLEELRLKRMAIEVQGGNVANILTPTDRGPPSA